MKKDLSISPIVKKVSSFLLLLSTVIVAMHYLVVPSIAAGKAASSKTTTNKTADSSKSDNTSSLGGDTIKLENTEDVVEAGQFNITSLITNNNNLYVQIKRDKSFKVTDKYVHPNCQTFIDSYKESFKNFKSSDSRLSNKVLNLISGEMQAKYKELASLPIKEQEYVCFLYNLFGYAEDAKASSNVTLSNNGSTDSNAVHIETTEPTKDENNQPVDGATE